MFAPARLKEASAMKKWTLALLALVATALCATPAFALPFPTITSANRTLHLNASNINNDGGLTDPGNGNDVNTWTDTISGLNLNHNFPTDGKGTFLSAGSGGIGNEDTVRFVSSGTGVGDDLMLNNSFSFNARTLYAVATMVDNTHILATLACNGSHGYNIRQDVTVSAKYYSGNSGDFIDSSAGSGPTSGAFYLNGNPRWDIPGGFGAAHVVKAVRNTTAAYSGFRISDNITPDRRWNGDVAEIIAFDNVLSGNDSARMNRYLGQKYGLPQVNDEVLTNTAQVANDPFYPYSNRQFAANFHYNPGAAVSSKLNGIAFDNIQLPVNATPPPGPYLLDANGPQAWLTLNFTPFTIDNTPRNQNAATTGPDAATLNAVANEMFYLSHPSISSGDHRLARMIFSSLTPDMDFYVQVIGGDSGWTGDISVLANGTSVGTWTTVADGAPFGANASLFTFFTRSDASGILQLDFSVTASNYAAISGIILTELAPEPATLTLLGGGLAALAARRRRRTRSAAIALLLILGLTFAGSAHALVVDEYWGAPALGSFGNTGSFRTAAHFPFFGGFTTNLAGVNFYYAPGGSVAAGSTLYGLAFDNIDLLSGQVPPTGPFALTANAPGVTLSLNFAFPAGSNSQRLQTAGLAGTDAATANAMAQEMGYIGGDHSSAQLAFSGLGADRKLYVQLVGGDQASGWNGDLRVRANGVATASNWTNVADGSGNRASLFGFNTTANAAGQLTLDLDIIAGSVAGLSGVVLLGQAQGLSAPVFDKNLDFVATSEVRGPTNNAPFGLTCTRVAAGVNFYYSGGGPVSVPVTAGPINGIAFDNIDLAGKDGVLGPYALTANGVPLTLDLLFPQANDAGGRNLNVATTGPLPDRTALQQLLNGMRYLDGTTAGSYHNPTAVLLSGLMRNNLVYVQLFGGSNNWNGQPEVFANGDLVGLWTTNPGLDTIASTFGFFAYTDGKGWLSIDLALPNGAAPYAGLAGFTVQEFLPEPGTVTLLAFGAAGLWARRRRNR